MNSARADDASTQILLNVLLRAFNMDRRMNVAAFIKTKVLTPA